MEPKIGKIDTVEQETLVAAVKAAHDADNSLSGIEKARRLNHQRQAIAANADCQRLRSHMLKAVGIDQCEVERCRERDITEMRAFLEKEGHAIVDQSGIVAKRHTQLACQRHEGLCTYGQLGTFAQPQSFITLDIADLILKEPASPITAPGFELDIKSDPPASMNNFVKGYAFAEGELAAQGPQFRADFLFHWTTEVDVLLNAVTFVQLNGMYGVYDAWTPFDDTFTCVSLSSSLRYFVPPPPFKGNLTSTSTQTQDNIDHCVEVGPFDFLGKADFGNYSDEFTLYDNNFFKLPAGYTIIFVVSVIGKLFTGFHGFGDFPPNCSLQLDFRSGDFGINVPAIYLSAFNLIS